MTLAQEGKGRDRGCLPVDNQGTGDVEGQDLDPGAVLQGEGWLGGSSSGHACHPAGASSMARALQA